MFLSPQAAAQASEAPIRVPSASMYIALRASTKVVYRGDDSQTWFLPRILFGRSRDDSCNCDMPASGPRHVGPGGKCSQHAGSSSSPAPMRMHAMCLLVNVSVFSSRPQPYGNCAALILST